MRLSRALGAPPAFQLTRQRIPGQTAVVHLGREALLSSGVTSARDLGSHALRQLAALHPFLKCGSEGEQRPLPADRRLTQAENPRKFSLGLARLLQRLVDAARQVQRTQVLVLNSENDLVQQDVTRAKRVVDQQRIDFQATSRAEHANPP